MEVVKVQSLNNWGEQYKFNYVWEKVKHQSQSYISNRHACSGDFLDSKSLPEDYEKVYLKTWGIFIIVFIVLFYLIMLWTLCMWRRIHNEHKFEYKKKKALIVGMVWKQIVQKVIITNLYKAIRLIHLNIQLHISILYYYIQALI